MNLQDMKVRPEREWAYRLTGLAAAFLIMLSLALTAVTVRDNVIAAQFDKLMQAIYRISADHGMYVEDVIVEGNRRTSYEDLVQALNLSENESILGIDIAKLQNRIEQLTWVRKCVVKREFFRTTFWSILKNGRSGRFGSMRGAIIRWTRKGTSSRLKNTSRTRRFCF